MEHQQKQKDANGNARLEPGFQDGFSSTLKKHYTKISTTMREQRAVFVLIADEFRQKGHRNQ